MFMISKRFNTTLTWLSCLGFVLLVSEWAYFVGTNPLNPIGNVYDFYSAKGIVYIPPDIFVGTIIFIPPEGNLLALFGSLLTLFAVVTSAYLKSKPSHRKKLQLTSFSWHLFSMLMVTNILGRLVLMVWGFPELRSGRLAVYVLPIGFLVLGCATLLFMFMLYGRSWLKLLDPYFKSPMKSAIDFAVKLIYNKKVFNWILSLAIVFGFFVDIGYMLGKLGIIPYLSIVDFVIRALRLSRLFIPYIFLVLVSLHFLLREKFQKNFLSLSKRQLVGIFSFLIFTFFVWCLFHAPLNDPELRMMDDKARYNIWNLMRGGKGYYESFDTVWPGSYWVWYPTMFFIWVLSSSVAEIKFLYFLFGTVAIVSTFLMVKKLSGNELLGILSALYFFDLFARTTWFMLENWALSTYTLGMTFFTYALSLFGVIFMFISYLIRGENMIFILAIGFLVFLLLRRKKETLEWAGALALSLIIVAIHDFAAKRSLLFEVFLTSGTPESVFLVGFYPEHILLHLTWFMFPIGLTNFLLAILGCLTIKRIDLKLLFLSIIGILNVIFLTTPTFAAFRYIIGAIGLEYALAPLGWLFIYRYITAKHS